MTWVGIALDTCLLRDLEAGPLDEYWARIDIASRLRNAMNAGSIKLLLDYAGFILREYENLPPDRLGRKFVNQALKNGNTHYANGSLTKHAEKALSEHDVDNDDFPFIAVAQTIQGYYVTTEAKHLTAFRRELIARNCGVTVARFEELPEYLSL